MRVAIVVVTHNRLEYTKKTIARLLEDKNEEFDLYLWDNASDDNTPEYLKDGIDDPRVTEVFLSNENAGQVGGMNYVWGKTKAELVGKLDNDCLVTPGWTRILAQAHKDVPRLGAVACWHFFPQDFDYDLAKGKIQSFGEHRVFRHPWVGGTGFLMKRQTFLECGPWKGGADVGTTYYFLQMALRGYINGWYYPLVFQEHMDDPMSEHSMLKTDQSIEELHDVTYTLRNRDIRTMRERLMWRDKVIKDLLCSPWEAKRHVGWRKKWQRAQAKLRRLCGKAWFRSRLRV